MNDFDLKKFLIENKLTTNSRMLNKTKGQLNEAIEAKAWLVDEEDGLPTVFRYASVEAAERNRYDETADDPYNLPLFTSLEDLKKYLDAQYMRDYDIEPYRFVKNT